MRRFPCGSIPALVLSILATGAPHSPASEPIDDKALKQRFERVLGAAVDGGQVVSPATLLDQLGTRRARARFSLATPSLPADSGEAPSLYDRLCASTLIVGHVYDCDKCDKWHGSFAGGVLIGPGGIGVTCHHVLDVRDAGGFAAMDRDGTVYRLKRVLASSRAEDIAIFQLEDCPLPPVTLAPAAEPGDTIHVLSHPDSHFFTYTRGVVARYHLVGRAAVKQMQITADFARGSSGCGIFDEEGRLAGIVATTTSIYYDREEDRDVDLQMVIRSCVPVDRIRALIDPVVEGTPSPGTVSGDAPETESTPAFLRPRGRASLPDRPRSANP